MAKRIRDKKEIQERITNLKRNLNLVQSETGKRDITIWIKTLEEFKDKSEYQIRNSVKDDNSERDNTIKWILGVLE